MQARTHVSHVTAIVTPRGSQISWKDGAHIDTPQPI
jgi:hypothetical protein